MPRKPDPPKTQTIKITLRQSVWEKLEAMARSRTVAGKEARRLPQKGRITLTMVIQSIVDDCIPEK